MSINRYRPHLLIYPEDDADRNIVNGFVLQEQYLDIRAVQIMDVLGGYENTNETLTRECITALRKYKERHILWVIDFDNRSDRYDYLKKRIPLEFEDRVFIIASSLTPEKLKASFGKSPEEIGKGLAHDCVNGTNDYWGHELLQHNHDELQRLIKFVKPFLFNSL